MNILLVLTCKTCEEDTDCRIGFSNRTLQPLRFSCPHCTSLIEVTLDIKYAPGYELLFKDGEQRDDRQYRPFDGRNPFVDLHLDFPVVFGKYEKGLTPFMAAMERVRTDSGATDVGLLRFMEFTEKLNQLNYFADRSTEIRTATKLYFGKNKQLFKRRVEQLIHAELGPSILPQDMNAALYKLISHIFQPFIITSVVRDFVKDLSDMVMNLAESKPGAFDTFIGHIIDTGFLSNIQRDCLEIYPEIYEAELALRPAIFLDLINGSDDQMIAGRISANEFPVYKDLYKDLCEILGRQLNLVAGINNIIHRDSHDAFAATKDGPPLSSLRKLPH